MLYTLVAVPSQGDDGTPEGPEYEGSQGTGPSSANTLPAVALHRVARKYVRAEHFEPMNVAVIDHAVKLWW